MNLIYYETIINKKITFLKQTILVFLSSNCLILLCILELNKRLENQVKIEVLKLLNPIY